MNASNVTTTAADFSTWTHALHVIVKRADAKLGTIVARDNEWQQRVASRGGTVTSALSEGAQEAAAKVAQARDREVETFAAAKRQVVATEHARHLTATRDAAAAFGDALEALAGFEYSMNGFLATAKQPTRPAVAADGELRSRITQFVERVQQMIDPPAPRRRPAPAGPLARPTFTDIVS
jgi:hypothetical protein